MLRLSFFSATWLNYGYHVDMNNPFYNRQIYSSLSFPVILNAESKTVFLLPRKYCSFVLRRPSFWRWLAHETTVMGTCCRGHSTIHLCPSTRKECPFRKPTSRVQKLRLRFLWSKWLALPVLGPSRKLSNDFLGYTKLSLMSWKMRDKPCSTPVLLKYVWV